MDPVRLMIVDDQTVFREALEHVLSEHPEFTVVAHHATLTEAVDTLSTLPVDVVLLDFNLGSERGGSLLTWAADNSFALKFLVLADELSDADALWLIKHGASGMFLKQKSLADLIAAIRTVAAGGKWLDQDLLKMVMDQVANGAGKASAMLVLTERERSTLRLVVQGCTNKEIGERLNISEAAVKATVQRLFDKTNVRNRGHLIRVAVQKYANYL